MGSILRSGLAEGEGVDDAPDDDILSGLVGTVRSRGNHACAEWCWGPKYPGSETAW
jgi:hypothetical protein